MVIGGTNLFGGEGDIMGAVVGSLIIAVLQTGLVNQLQTALERLQSSA